MSRHESQVNRFSQSTVIFERLNQSKLEKKQIFIDQSN